MLPRILNLSNEIDSSIFLFGARQTGKSTILRQQFPNAIYIDLLDSRMEIYAETFETLPAGKFSEKIFSLEKRIYNHGLKDGE